MNNPLGNLVSLDAHNWSYKGKACLIGDSAHAIVPFYGQGMNCGFEDCRILNEYLNRYDNLHKCFDAFSKNRKPNSLKDVYSLFKNYYNKYTICFYNSEIYRFMFIMS